MTYPAALLSSEKMDWATPQSLFETLDAEFEFTLDPCASFENAKCQKYYTAADNGLTKDWGSARAFYNSPYGTHLKAWAQKCYEASQDGALVVALLPASTGTRWFHDWVLGKAELRFVKGRLKFGGAAHSAPFSSITAVYRPISAQIEFPLSVPAVSRSAIAAQPAFH